MAAVGQRVSLPIKGWEEVAELFHPTLFIFGGNRSGKTVNASTLAWLAERTGEGRKTLLIDTEGGFISVPRELRPYIDLWIYRQASDYDKLISTLQGFVRDPKPYEVGGVIFDSISGLREISVLQILDLKVTSDRQTDAPEILSQKGWGRVHKRVRDVSMALRDIPAPVVATIQEDVDRDTNNNVFRIKPRLSDSLMGIVPGDYHVIGYIGAKQERRPKKGGTKGETETVTVRKIRLAPSSLLESLGDRTWTLEDEYEIGHPIKDPIMPKIVDLIRGGIK